MEWFSKLEPEIQSFEELINRFITHFSFNIQHGVTLKELYNTKQAKGEKFLSFLQRWRRLFAKYPRSISEEEKIEMFIDNLVDDMNYRLDLQCPSTFEQVIEKGLKIEEALIKRGTIKHFIEGSNNNNSSNNNNKKPKFWQKNKNIDTMIDTHTSKLVFTLTPTPTNKKNNGLNVKQSSDQGNNQNSGETKTQSFQRPSNK